METDGGNREDSGKRDSVLRNVGDQEVWIVGLNDLLVKMKVVRCGMAPVYQSTSRPERVG